MGYQKYFTAEHNIFRSQVRSFVEKEIVPNVEKWEEEGLFPREIFKKMGDLGFLGLRYPEAMGGAGVDYWYTVAFLEELARSFCAGLRPGHPHPRGQGRQ